MTCFKHFHCLEISAKTQPQSKVFFYLEMENLGQLSLIYRYMEYPSLYLLRIYKYFSIFILSMSEY